MHTFADPHLVCSSRRPCRIQQSSRAARLADEPLEGPGFRLTRDPEHDVTRIYMLVVAQGS
eukprot:6193620-Pleurochrysis_carterae.AAC.1